jgi:hypothetical protein
MTAPTFKMSSGEKCVASIIRQQKIAEGIYKKPRYKPQGRRYLHRMRMCWGMS